MDGVDGLGMGSTLFPYELLPYELFPYGLSSYEPFPYERLRAKALMDSWSGISHGGIGEGSFHLYKSGDLSVYYI